MVLLGAKLTIYYDMTKEMGKEQKYPCFIVHVRFAFRSRTVQKEFSYLCLVLRELLFKRLYISKF